MYIEVGKICEACLQSTTGQCAAHTPNVSITVTPGAPVMSFQLPFVPQGWQCPCCRHVLAPHVSMCPICPSTATLTYTTTSSIGSGG